jgi:hypothetical protein
LGGEQQAAMRLPRDPITRVGGSEIFREGLRGGVFFAASGKSYATFASRGPRTTVASHHSKFASTSSRLSGTHWARSKMRFGLLAPGIESASVGSSDLLKEVLGGDAEFSLALATVGAAIAVAIAGAGGLTAPIQQLGS